MSGVERGYKVVAVGGLLVILLASIMAYLGFIPVTAQTNVVTVSYHQGAIPLNPEDGFWKGLGKKDVVLAAQLLAYPQRLDTTPRRLSFTAVHNGTHFAIYIEWDDNTMNTTVPGGLDKFPDAVAVQFPTHKGEQPYVCMGMPNNPVEIVLWKAGVGAENLVAGSGYGMHGGAEQEARGLQETPTSPIEMLPPEDQVWTAKAVYSNGKWHVVLVRPSGGVGNYTPSLNPGDTISVAFALWDGGKYERAGSKVTSGWISLKLEAPAPPTGAVKTVTVTTTQTTTQTIGKTSTVTQTTTQTVTTTATETVTTPAATGPVKAAIVGFMAAVIIAVILFAILYRKGAFKGG